MNYQTKDVNFYTADPYTNHSRIIRQYVRINGFDNSIVTNYRIIHLYHGQSNKLIRAVTNADKTYISWIMDTYVPQTYLSRTEFFFLSVRFSHPILALKLREQIIWLQLGSREPRIRVSLYHGLE